MRANERRENDESPPKIKAFILSAYYDGGQANDDLPSEIQIPIFGRCVLDEEECGNLFYISLWLGCRCVAYTLYSTTSTEIYNENPSPTTNIYIHLIRRSPFPLAIPILYMCMYLTNDRNENGDDENE